MRYANDAPEPNLRPPHPATNAANGQAAPFRAAHWFVLGLAIAVGAFLRLCNLEVWSFWIDEAHTWRDSTIPWSALPGDRKLYSLPFALLRVLLGQGWIGNDEYSLRFPFVLVGIATVPLLAICGRRAIGAWPAVLAAWLIAVHPWHVYWSQNARGYVLVFAFAVIAANRGLVFAETQRLRDFFATMAAVLVGSVCHPAAALQGLGFVAFLVLRRFPTLHGRGFLRIAVIVIAAGLLLPWIVDWLPFRDFFISKSSPSLMHLAQTTAYYYVPVVILTAFVGLMLGWRLLGRERAMLLGCMWIVPFFVLATIGTLVAKVTARYALCTLPVVTWLAAFACSRIGTAVAAETGSWSRRATAVVLPLLLLAGHGLEVWTYHTERHGDRARWREACSFVSRSAGTGALRVLTVNHPTVVFYLRPTHWEPSESDPYPAVQVVPLVGWMVNSGQNEARQPVCEPGARNHLRWNIAEARRSQAQFFVMITRPELADHDDGSGVDPRGGILQEIERGFDLVLCLPCWVGPKDESVYVYAPKRE